MISRENANTSGRLLPSRSRTLAPYPDPPAPEVHQTNRYDTISHDLVLSSPMITYSALGLSLPFTPQVNMNDMDSLFFVLESRGTGWNERMMW